MTRASLVAGITMALVALFASSTHAGAASGPAPNSAVTPVVSWTKIARPGNRPYRFVVRVFGATAVEYRGSKAAVSDAGRASIEAPLGVVRRAVDGKVTITLTVTDSNGVEHSVATRVKTPAVLVKRNDRRVRSAVLREGRRLITLVGRSGAARRWSAQGAAMVKRIRVLQTSAAPASPLCEISLRNIAAAATGLEGLTIHKLVRLERLGKAEARGRVIGRRTSLAVGFARLCVT